MSNEHKIKECTKAITAMRHFTAFLQNELREHPSEDTSDIVDYMTRAVSIIEDMKGNLQREDESMENIKNAVDSIWKNYKPTEKDTSELFDARMDYWIEERMLKDL